MTAQTDVTAEGTYRRILVAVDSSEHSNGASLEATRLARLWDSRVTGLHAYAARLHDLRFRQMEGSLPEPFQVEKELERQRKVHDVLIGRGLELISDSYLEDAEKNCLAAGVPFERLGIEGKNYTVIVDEIRRGGHDLVILGAQGLGKVRPDVIGSVCQRVVRRSTIDTLVIKQPAHRIGDGPIVVGLDGSHQSFGGLVTALELGKRLGCEVHAVAAYDPFFHTVAFERIAEVLTVEAAKVFHFQAQEKLHAEIIDTGLAKVYQAHLSIAEHIAQTRGAKLATVLLSGKPFEALLAYTTRVGASLLVLGKLGIHADDDLDIGGNTEQLLQLAECNLLVSHRRHEPAAEVVARETMSWTEEAEARLARAPSFVRRMARSAIIRHALERGHTVVTAAIVDQATSELMPQMPGGAAPPRPLPQHEEASGSAHAAPEASGSLPWDDDAKALIDRVPAGFMQQIVAQRVELLARQRGLDRVTVELVRDKYDGWRKGSQEVTATLEWDEDAYEAIRKAPDIVRGMVIREVEAGAARDGVDRVTLAYVNDARRRWQLGEFHAAPGRGQGGKPSA